MTTRPATLADVRSFYPGMGTSFRAWVAEIDGKPEGMLGFALTYPTMCMFSVAREALRPHLKRMPILRGIKWAQGILRASKLPVLAIAEPGEPEAPRILTRLGFEPMGEFGGDMIYRFTPGETA